MHEFGNYLGTLEFAAMPIEFDEEYEAYLNTLSRKELEEEMMNIKAQIEAMDKLDRWKG